MWGFSVNCMAPSSREALPFVLRAAAALSSECGLWVDGETAEAQFKWLAEKLEQRNAEFRTDLAGVEMREERRERIEQDGEDMQGAHSHGWLPDAAEAANALATLILTPHIRAYLETVDPNAVTQARSALRLASHSPAEDNPEREYEEPVPAPGTMFEGGR